MRVKRIIVRRFKSINLVDYSLDDINVIIGGNNSGKSSFLQAIQFATSIVQTILTQSRVIFKNDEFTTTLSPEQLVYSPARDIFTLAYGKDELTQVSSKSIQIEFQMIKDGDAEISALISIRRGKNKNLSVSLRGNEACQVIGNIKKPFSMYVPGLAGVPYNEEYKAEGSIRRAVAKGDSNTILRNVLFLLNREKIPFDNFTSFLRRFFPTISINVIANLERDGLIDVFVIQDGITKPIDTVGTGVLQAIQIAAYTFFFNPQLLLLDEPDSHLHPNNQRVLADLVRSLSEESDHRVILATHSRHLLSALRKDSSIVMMKSGGCTNYTDDFDILLEIGALDSYDSLKNPQIRYLILTEDSAIESNAMLSNIFISSGYSHDEFLILPYAGVTKIESAIFVATCILQLRSDLKVIVHRDRDSLYDDEVAEIEERVGAVDNVHCFVTKYSDLEMYYCNPNHIKSYLDNNFSAAQIPIEDIKALVKSKIISNEENSKIKFFNRRLDPLHKDSGKEAIAAQKFFDENKLRCSYGKSLIGLIRQELQKRVKSNVSLIDVSEYLSLEKLRKIKQSSK